jgi:hypothetical protein
MGTYSYDFSTNVKEFNRPPYLACRLGGPESFVAPHLRPLLDWNEFGHARTFPKFCANIEASGHATSVIPLRHTSTGVLRILAHYIAQDPTFPRPSIIYLDSSHDGEKSRKDKRKERKS